MALTATKIGDYFNSGQKIVSALGAVIFVISTITIAYYKINQNAIAYEELKHEVEHKFEDVRDSNIKLRTKILDLEARVNRDEVDAAYHKGHSDATEEFLKAEIRRSK